jgi:hypothetical protein
VVCFENSKETFVVDLFFNPGHLYPELSPLAMQYTKVCLLKNFHSFCLLGFLCFVILTNSLFDGFVAIQSIELFRAVTCVSTTKSFTFFK